MIPALNATFKSLILFIVTLLNDNNIDKWFVCYGTLLGLVRENSCIDNDDDIDIIIEKGHYYESQAEVLNMLGREYNQWKKSNR